MKRVVLFLVLACSCTYLSGQSLIWESEENVRPRSLNLSSFIFSQSDVLTDDFNDDDFVDVVTGVIYRDSLFYLMKIMDDIVQFSADDAFFSSSTQFLGYLKIPDIAGESIVGNRPLVFGNSDGGNIIGILVAKLSADQESVSFQPLDIGSAYRFLSFTDFNEDGVADYLLFNRDEKRLQVWQF